ncbi:MAG: Zn-ribbon domain-containing OB-fold protein [Proteobacteria bacterium]|nr:Zn-ribbon domain-containing OB-fold protein [Pseudomonadota bacterium]
MSARPIPPTSALTQPYWDAAGRGQMTVQRCEQCEHRPFPPRATCPSCGGSSLSWSPVSGRAKVYSYTVAYRAPHPVFAAQLPLVVAIVELEEGPRMVTNIVGCDPADVEVGMAVEFTPEPIDDTDMVLPVFSPTNESG